MHAQVPIQRILVGIDFSDSARQAFYAAMGLAARLDAEAFVLHVAEPIRAFDFGKRRYVETAETIERVEEGVKRRLDELWKEGGAGAVDRRKVHVIVRGGKAAPEIVATAKAKKVDLIVLGSSEKGGFGSALGSVPAKVMHDAHCSVLCIRARSEPQE